MAWCFHFPIHKYDFKLRYVYIPFYPDKYPLHETGICLMSRREIVFLFHPHCIYGKCITKVTVADDS